MRASIVGSFPAAPQAERAECASPSDQRTWTRVYQVALDLGDPGGDNLLADLQDEARQRLPQAELLHRIVVIGIAPGQSNES